MADLYKTSGEVVSIEPKNGSDFSLDELQGYVGGMIQIVPIGEGKVLVCNEEGKLEGLPYNEAATLLMNGTDFIVGNSVVCDAGLIN